MEDAVTVQIMCCRTDMHEDEQPVLVATLYRAHGGKWRDQTVYDEAALEAFIQASGGVVNVAAAFRAARRPGARRSTRNVPWTREEIRAGRFGEPDPDTALPLAEWDLRCPECQWTAQLRKPKRVRRFYADLDRAEALGVPVLPLQAFTP